MLIIVLIPSLALLLIGAGAAGYLVNQGIKAEDWSTSLANASDSSFQFIAASEEERRLSLLRVAGDEQDSANLERQRQVSDNVLGMMNVLATTLTELNPGVLDSAASQFVQIFTALGAIRHKVDAGQATAQEVYTFYNQLVDVVTVAFHTLAKTSPDSESAVEESTATYLLAITDAMSRSNALAAGGVARGGMTPDELIEFIHQVGSYHGQIESLLPRLLESGRAEYAALVASDAWKKQVSVENALLQGKRLPMTLPDWQAAAGQVTNGLRDIARNHHTYAQDTAAQGGETTFWQSLLAGIGILLIAAIAFVIALRLSHRLVNRLKRLRKETLDLADEKLPRIVAQLRDGKPVDLEAEVASLDYGRDEIGEVAAAFNKAQQTAVAAAVQEAKTRQGVNAVFLNIAHRSQVVVHRQLEVLDEAERKQEDPDQLELLFKLDHLATRSRRNAENLLILGGTQPGRQWRNPVPLVEVVRSAVAETEDYARVRTGQLPAVAMVGAVVADLVHLLAELVDNASSFSPPESRVEVRGNVVGKGVVVEVEDQGLGITKDERERINASLQHAPDFGVMSLSDDARLGLFVVSRLASRHGISVTLAESPYGGTRAIVLIRANLIAPVAEEPEPESEAGPTAPSQRQSGHRAPFEPVVAPTQTIWPVEEPSSDGPKPRHAQPVAPAQPVASPQPVPAAQPAMNDDRPPLPRRRRQANLAPQLTGETAVLDKAPATDRSAEEARDVMSAFQRGTRQAREQ